MVTAMPQNGSSECYSADGTIENHLALQDHLYGLSYPMNLTPQQSCRS